jgi:hypothetical protein
MPSSTFAAKKLLLKTPPPVAVPLSATRHYSEEEYSEVQIDFNDKWWFKHDMDKFSGRLGHWVKVTDPLKCFASESSIQKDIEFLEAAK